MGYEMWVRGKRFWVTNWFPMSINPVRVGHYFIDGKPILHDGGSVIINGLRYWDGKRWYMWENGPVSMINGDDAFRWCGVAKP